MAAYEGDQSTMKYNYVQTLQQSVGDCVVMERSCLPEEEGSGVNAQHIRADEGWLWSFFALN